MDLISRTDLMNDLDTSVVFSGRTHEAGEHNSEVVGAQKVINRIEAAPEVKAIPVEWIEEWVKNYCKSYEENLIKCLLKTWEKENEIDDLLPNCVKHARVMKEIENQLEERNGK